MSILINCSVTAMEVSGSEPTTEASSMCITAGQTHLRNQMASQEISSPAFSKIARAISGSPPLEDSTDFESFPWLRLQRDKACPATGLNR